MAVLWEWFKYDLDIKVSKAKDWKRMRNKHKYNQPNSAFFKKQLPHPNEHNNPLVPIVLHRKEPLLLELRKVLLGLRFGWISSRRLDTLEKPLSTSTIMQTHVSCLWKWSCQRKFYWLSQGIVHMPTTMTRTGLCGGIPLLNNFAKPSIMTCSFADAISTPDCRRVICPM